MSFKEFHRNHLFYMFSPTPRSTGTHTGENGCTVAQTRLQAEMGKLLAVVITVSTTGRCSGILCVSGQTERLYSPRAHLLVLLFIACVQVCEGRATSRGEMTLLVSPPRTWHLRQEFPAGNRFHVIRRLWQDHSGS